MKLVDIEPYKGKVIASHTYCGVNKLIEVDALEEISEQEIVKPYLDKIRAEIEQVKYIMNEEIINHDRKDLINFVNGLNQSLAIIDKYTAEKE